MTTNFTIKQGAKGLFATGMLAMLVACGGGGGGSSSDSSSSSSPVVARGVITQLGSIWVTGCRYVAVAGGTYKSDDGEPNSFDDYVVGQTVSIKGTKSAGSSTCVANEVEYEAEVEGAADANGQILGITIVQTPRTNAPGIPATLANGQRYEVSGIWIDGSTLEATFIKLDDDGDGEDEIKGYVKNLAGGSFDVRSITFTGYSGTPALDNEDFVEVHFNPATCSAPPVSCTLTSVELEDDYFDQAEGLEIEIEGAANLDTTGCPADADFKIDATCIDWDNKPAEFMDGLAGPADVVEGSRVEAEGHKVAGLLVADKIKGRGNRVRVSSIVSSVNRAEGSFGLIEDNITVTTITGVTDFEDSLFINAGDDNVNGQTVEVRGVRTGPSELLALRVKLTGLSGGGDRHELRAEVDSVTVVQDNDWLNDRLTVMGIVSRANSGTDLEIGDMVIADSDTNPATAEAIEDFLLTIDADNNPANGPRDVVEIGVDVTTGDGKATPYIADEWEVEEEDD